VAAMKRAPEELEARSPLAHIVYSQCVRHRGHHLEQLQAWIAVFPSRSERKFSELVSTQPDSADAGQGLTTRRRTIHFWMRWAGIFVHSRKNQSSNFHSGVTP